MSIPSHDSGRARGLTSSRWLVLFALTLSLLLGPLVPVRAFTIPVFTNLSDVVNPSIDATSIVNIGTINASSSSLLFNSFLYQTINTLNVTNTLRGVFSGDVGFDFAFTTNTFRFPANNHVNQGSISGDTIFIEATNILNTGSLQAGELLQLRGNTVNVSRSVLTATLGNSSTLSTTGYRSVSTNGTVTYRNPSSVADVYWGAGTGNVMTAFSGVGFGLDLISLSSPSGGFFPPQSASPSHEVVQIFSGGLGGGSLSSLAFLSGTNYGAYVRTNRQGTNLNIQVVLVQTNSANTNLAVDVRFLSSSGANFFSGNTPIVRFSTFGSDITTGGLYTNNLFFLDYINTRTNAQLSANLNAGSFRPAAYEFVSGSLYDSYFTTGFGTTTNANISSISYYQPGYELATVTNNFYAAWRATVGSASSAPGSATYVPHLDDPTNFPGRVDITANNLDISRSRIKADNLVSLRATNLISSEAVIIDAPYIQLFIANTNSTLTLTNFAAQQVSRANGTLSFYSTVWTNRVTNATPQLSLRYHVLMVDASQLTGVTPVTLQEFDARGTNVVINNALNIGRAFQINSPAVTFSASSSLSLPLLSATNLGSANFPNVNFFTNLGAITVPFECSLGSDRLTPIGRLVNRGSFTANNISIRATEYESSGTNLTRSLSSGKGGPISIQANSAKFDGGTAGGFLSAGGSVLLSGNDIKIRNHLITTAGTLVLSPTNSLTDTGASGTNRINCALGFSLTVKPASGDLLGTTISSSATFNRDVPHLWAGTDFGPVPAGYSNNAALGRLLLDTSNNIVSLNRLSFSGTSTNNALYVDYLELNGTLTNDLASHLFIETNMTLYFANANVAAESLDGQLGGRLRWVKDYAGLNTGVDVRLADGRTVKVNVAKLNSPVLDSDADGVVNASDLSPFDGVVLNTRVAFTNVPPLTAFITWEAAAQTVYQVEVSTNLLGNAWQFLANYTNAATTNRVVTFSDPVPAGGTERYFRVTYQP